MTLSVFRCSLLTAIVIIWYNYICKIGNAFSNGTVVSTTNYYYDGNKLIAEVTGNEIVVYLYDASGSPIGFQYRDGSYARDDWDVFWYQKNLQGDIIAIYDNTGKREMTYNYTAWGHMVTSNCLDIDFDNPFTYRGYYYDHDLHLYYLNSRYYDSTNCRFINADSALYHQMLGYNMFAYCYNDPVNYVDYSGENSDVLGWWFSIAGSIALAEPTCAGEVVVVVGAVIAIGVLLYAEEQLDDVKIVPPQSLPDAEDGEEAESSVPEVGDSAGELPQQGNVTVVPGAPPVEAGKQGKHVHGHKNNDPNKSQWSPGENGVRQTQEAWKNSQAHPSKPNTRIGISNDGRTIEIKVSNNGIHGYPIFP